jgi:hydroxymethylpyrimidine pyrophosphatase-like HAD family hydrolase
VDELISCVEEAVPTVGFQVNSFHNTYFCKYNIIMENFRRGTGLPDLTADYKNFTQPVCRVVFGCKTEDEISAVEGVLRSHPRADEYDFVRSERVLFEILPKGVNKGVSITKLTEYLGIDPRKAVAIGDYNNDIPMFKAAGLGIAVANACADAKAEADFITVSNLEHAVARVIYDIEKGVYPI